MPFGCQWWVCTAAGSWTQTSEQIGVSSHVMVIIPLRCWNRGIWSDSVSPGPVRRALCVRGWLVFSVSVLSGFLFVFDKLTCRECLSSSMSAWRFSQARVRKQQQCDMGTASSADSRKAGCVAFIIFHSFPDFAFPFTQREPKRWTHTDSQHCSFSTLTSGEKHFRNVTVTHLYVLWVIHSLTRNDCLE